MPVSPPVYEVNTFSAPKTAIIYKQQQKAEEQKKAYHILWQDKNREENGSPASIQPGSYKNVIRTAQTNNSLARAQNHNNQHAKLEKVSSWLEPILKSKLQEKARREGLSVSGSIAAIIKQHFRTEADMQYSAFIEPVIERVLSKYLRQRDTRLISLLVRIAFDSGQTRSIVTNILGMQPDITPELLRTIILESDRHAKLNISRKTPQMTELMNAIQKLFFEQGREETAD